MPSDEIWQGDLYALTGKALIEGLLEGDATLFSGDINVLGKVTQDLNAAAGEVRLSGEVGDDLHVATSKLLLSGAVGGDLLVWSGQAELAREGLVRGSAVIYSGQVDLQGPIEGAVKITGGKVELNGEVGGDVAVSCDGLIIGPQAHIAGRLVYDARNTIDVAPESSPGDRKAEHRLRFPLMESPEDSSISQREFKFFWNLFLAVVALIAGVLLLLFFRPFVEGALDRAARARVWEPASGSVWSGFWCCWWRECCASASAAGVGNLVRPRSTGLFRRFDRQDDSGRVDSGLVA